MANALASPHIFEIAFDALTTAVGGPRNPSGAASGARADTLLPPARPMDLDSRCGPDHSRTIGGGVGGFLSTKHDRGCRRGRRRTDRRMFCRFGLAPDRPGGERGNLFIEEGSQRGSPDRLGQSILLPPGGGAADRTL